MEMLEFYIAKMIFSRKKVYSHLVGPIKQFETHGVQGRHN